MDFIFEDIGESDFERLRQGDLLKKTPGVIDILNEPHAYYANADDYEYFMVLTQSCDLVRRSGVCKSRYITIAAVRPLEVYFERALESLSKVEPGAGIRICDGDQRKIVKQLSERLINNTAPDVFYIGASEKIGVSSDYCVFLQLSVALRAEHYDGLLKAKSGQMREIFAAKLGRVVGDMYSRVGTPDLGDHHEKPEEFKRSFFERLTDKSILWVSARQKKLLKRRIRERYEEGNQTLSIDDINKLIDELPDQKTLISDRAVEILRKKNFIDDDKLGAASAALKSDPALFNLIKEYTG